MSFAEKNKDISILTISHINHDQIYHQIHIRNNWLDSIFFSPGDNHTKRSLVLLHPGLEGITEVDTDPKVKFDNGLWIYGEGRIQIPLNSPAMVGLY